MDVEILRTGVKSRYLIPRDEKRLILPSEKVLVQTGVGIENGPGHISSLDHFVRITAGPYG